MKNVLFSLLFACNIFCASAKDLPNNHVDLTAAILDFLSRTELCLNSCQCAESTKQAIPTLRELKTEADKLTEIQRNLPEPTIQDYMAVQKKTGMFNTIWKAIRDHIERMENEQIMTQEIRDILFIAPPSPEL